jgi:hypothetical protein
MGWNLRLKVHNLQILYMCLATTHFIRNYAKFGHEQGCLIDIIDLSKTLFALGSLCPLFNETQLNSLVRMQTRILIPLPYHNLLPRMKRLKLHHS